MRAPRPPLRPDQWERYRRHLALPEFGPEAQQRLLDARVLLVGVGGLGCPVAQYLAAAGVGTLGLLDSDVVDASNLQRQVLYGTADVGRPKVEVARERLTALNPDVKVEVHQERLGPRNALDLLRGWSVVVDGSDNFPTRYVVNDACVLLGTPNVHGAVFRFEGQATVFHPERGPCYRCLFPDPPGPGSTLSCAEGGVLGVLPGLVAMIQATETLKLLTGLGEPLTGRLLCVDALGVRFSEFRLQRDPACPVCGEAPEIRAPRDPGISCQAAEAPVRERSAAEVAALPGRDEAFLLLDVREPHEWEVARLEGARLIPLGALEERLEEVAAWRERPIVVHCHTGVRSAHACRLLARHGFREVWNLAGGIEAWSLTVDPRVPRY